MASPRKIDSRIKSTSKMRQITEAMNTASNSKLHRAGRNTKSFRPYMEKIRDAITTVAGSNGTSNHPVLKSRDIKRGGYLITTSGKGLAGAYSMNVLKSLVSNINSKHNDSSEYSLVVLGRQGVDFLKHRRYKIEDSLVEVPDQPPFKSIQSIAKHAIDLFSKKNIDESTIYYSHYVSVLENKPATKQVLPLSQEGSGQGHGQMSSYEFKPDRESISNVILPQCVESLIYGTILDAKTSEHASRMTAMRNASDSATELVDDLLLEYNRAKQTAITQQITETVGGSSTLE